MTTITIDRAVVEQALEALGLAKLNGKSGLHPAEIGEIADAITALRAALAQQAEPTRSQQMADAGFKPRDRRLECDECGGKFTAQMLPIHKCAQQAEPVEPVAWGVDWGRDGDRSCVSITKKRADGTMEVVAVEYGPLYTAPPQRKPLSADETMALANETAGANWGDEAHLQRFRAAVERAHGIEEKK